MSRAPRVAPICRAISLATSILLATAGSDAGIIRREWTLDVPGGTVGHPVPFGETEGADGVLVTAGEGKLLVIDPRGGQKFAMSLDLPASAPAITAEIWGKGKRGIVVADTWGSIYAFDFGGKRLWKYVRTSNAGGFRIPVLADLDGDGILEIVTTDARGKLIALDARGRPVLEIESTNYRLSPPSVGDIDGDGVPEIVFGTEDKEIHCVKATGEHVWSRQLEGRFGRTLPLIADADRDGRYEVYVSSAFNQARPGLFCVDATSGAFRWKAESMLQSYASTIVVDLDGDGFNEILFGDKNTQLYALDRGGRITWARQLGGRGLFFAPAIADLTGQGKATIFAEVRGSGPEGHSLYLVDSAGKVQEGVALPGGGVASPALCRFKGDSRIRLLTYSAGAKLTCFQIEQESSRSRILWPGQRHDPEHSGFLASSRPGKKLDADSKGPPQASRRLPALTGTNLVNLDVVPDAIAAITSRGPGAVVRTELIRPDPGSSVVSGRFAALEPGAYSIKVAWRTGLDNRVIRTEDRIYDLAVEAEVDAKELDTLKESLSDWKDPAADYAFASARADLEFARRRPSLVLFDEARGRRQYLGALARALSRSSSHPAGPVLAGLIEDPWGQFDTIAHFRDHDSRAAVELEMVGNEYESAALAVTNLQTTAATMRFELGPFSNASGKTVQARDVVEIREVPETRSLSSGRVIEDVLPSLGEGQTLRLGPLETRKVWFTFRSRELASGAYHASLRIGDLLALDPPLEVPIRVKVWDIRLPDRLTYRHGNWLYLASITDPRLREATMRDALEHGTNVFNVPSASVMLDKSGRIIGEDTEPHDSLVKALRGRAFLMIGGSVGMRWPRDFKPTLELESQAFVAAIRWYAEHMRSLGMRYEDYALYTTDEPGLMGADASFESYKEGVRKIKVADPSMQIYANPAGGARAEILGPIADMIDVWQPDLHLVREQPDELGALFRRAKQYWHYEAPGDQRMLDPLGYYRMKPWVAYQMGMTGGGYWVYSSAPYWFFDSRLGTEYGTVYPTDRGPVTTKRWEASRDGAEDFELLWQLRKAAERSQTSLAGEARRLEREAVAFVTLNQEKASDIARQLHPFRPDPGRWFAYRASLIQMLAKLRSGPKP